MQLLVAVINESEKLDEILSGFLELGITLGDHHQQRRDGPGAVPRLPIFAGLQTLIARSRPQNQTLFSVIKEEEKVEGALALLQEICGNFDDPATGIAFTIPVTRVVGLKPELGTEES